ncbi:MAG: 4-(cytidine 5'-diphospho)-2-C-methyl-D-erythritol kinase [Rhodospirillaceae bacterium]|nr:4-(cytidine 5'-diphospho)-2-C-methyl-D-erythritol kinase [Rhodospirillaceae bacterium]
MIRVEAPAKLNLYLHVTGRRADGYHELDSLVTFTALADTLEIAPADALALTVSGPFADALDADDNLATRAAMALAERLGRSANVWIALHKRVPVSAGLGGGSADAAAVLRGLARLWRLGPAHTSDLREIALGLGADVPACLDSRAAYMGGIGEALSPPPPLPPCGVLLVNPGVPVPTGPVFAARRRPFSASGRFREYPRDAPALANLLRTRRNDLEPPARAQVPEIGRVLESIAAAPGCLLARMSGSGGTCFGLFADEVAAGDAAGAIARERPGWWVQPTRLAHEGETTDVMAARSGS